MRQSVSIQGQELTEVFDKIGKFVLANGLPILPKPILYLIAPPYLFPLQCLFKERKFFRHLWASCRFGVHRCLFRAPYRFDKIQLKQNIRIMGLGSNSGATAKLQGLYDRRLKDEVAREIETRKLLLSEQLPIQIPELLSSNVTDGWLVEKLLNGRKPVLPADHKTLEHFLLNELPSFYQYFIDYETVQETVTRKGLDLLALIKYWPNGQGQLLENNLECYWQSSLCHNDLSLGNMLLVEGELFILDWGQARKNPVCFDLENLIAKNPFLKKECLKSLERLSLPESLGIQVLPNVQLAIAATIKCALRELNASDYLQYLKVVKNMDAHIATQQLEQSIRKKMMMIRNLLDWKQK